MPAAKMAMNPAANSRLALGAMAALLTLALLIIVETSCVVEDGENLQTRGAEISRVAGLIDQNRVKQELRGKGLKASAQTLRGVRVLGKGAICSQPISRPCRFAAHPQIYR
jgi:hypothetical protein